MHIKEALKQVEESKAYKDFIKKNPKFYLVHCFRLDEGNPPYGWQIGYYSKPEDKIAVFDVTPKGDVTLSPKEDVFKPTKKGIEPISLEHLEVFLDKALELVMARKKEKASADGVIKRMILLQKTGGKQVWNITLITDTFKLFNVKIDTTSGEIISESLDSILGLGKRT